MAEPTSPQPMAEPEIVGESRLREAVVAETLGPHRAVAADRGAIHFDELARDLPLRLFVRADLLSDRGKGTAELKPSRLLEVPLAIAITRSG